MITIQINIPASLGRKLEPAVIARALDATLEGCANVVLANIAKYPGPVRYPIQWASERQRRYYFWMRRKAGLSLQYVRGSDAMSQRLGASWAVTRSGQLAWTVGTRATYARFVQSAANQQPFHSNTGWKTDQQAATEFVQSGKVVQIAGMAIKSELGI